MAGKDTLVLVSKRQTLADAGGKEWMNEPALNELQVCVVGSGRQE